MIPLGHLDFGKRWVMEGIQSASTLPEVLAKVLRIFSDMVSIGFVLGLNMFNGISVDILLRTTVDKVRIIVQNFELFLKAVGPVVTSRLKFECS